MDRASLESFMLIAELHSFSRAAEQQHITQPAISKRIANLESILGTRLLTRHKRQIQLTHSGQVFLHHARALIEQMNDCQTAVQNTRQKIAGKLKLGVSHHIGLHRLPDFLKMFTDAFPDVQLQLRFINSEAAIGMIQTAELEIALTTLAEKPPATIYQQTVWQDPLHFVVSGSHALTAINDRKKLTLEMLCGHPAILPDKESHTGQIIHRLFRQHDLTINHFTETNNLETIRMMTSIGLGWTVLPRTMLNRQLQGLILENKTPGLKRQLGYVHHKSRILSNTAQAFLHTLTNHY